MEYWSVISKDKILPFATIRMNIKVVMLSEIRQIEKVENHISLICGL